MEELRSGKMAMFPASTNSFLHRVVEKGRG